jgi:predicted transposase YdaD
MAERTLMSFDWAIKKVLRHKENFDVERMSLEERRAYQRHIENRRIENSVIETAVDKSIRLRNIEIAKESLNEGFPIAAVAKISKLDVEEVTLLAEGKELDTDIDD